MLTNPHNRRQPFGPAMVPMSDPIQVGAMRLADLHLVLQIVHWSYWYGRIPVKWLEQVPRWGEYTRDRIIGCISVGRECLAVSNREGQPAPWAVPS